MGTLQPHWSNTFLRLPLKCTRLQPAVPAHALQQRYSMRRLQLMQCSNTSCGGTAEIDFALHITTSSIRGCAVALQLREILAPPPDLFFFQDPG